MEQFEKYTSSFKSLPRQKLSVWQYRTRKDVNDLNYYPKQLKDIEYIKKGSKSFQKNDRDHEKGSNNKIKKAMQKYNITPYNPNLNKISSSKINFKRQNSYQQRSTSSTNKINPQVLKTQQNLKLSIQKKTLENVGFVKRTSQGFFKNSKLNLIIENDKLNKLGLSSYQFGETTIQGKIHSKHGYNVDLSKCKTNKLNNLNKIFYNKDEIIDFHQMEKKRYVETLAKYRNFRSYSTRVLFKSNPVGQGGSLDKFYDVSNKQLDQVKKKNVLNIDLKKISPRPKLPVKLGTQLQYSNSYRQLANSNQHKPLYQTQKLKRQLSFSRQVISTSRGCYR